MNNPASSEKNFNRSEKMKQLWANGTFKRERTNGYKDHMSKLTKDKRAKGIPVTPVDRFKETNDPRLKHVAKGIDHHLGKYWKFQTPTGTIIQGINLSEIVRRNIHLFDPEDVKMNDRGVCRAIQCLAQLKYLKENGNPRRYQWKGWKLLMLKNLSTGKIEFAS